MSNAADLTADLDALVADAVERLADASDLDALAALDAELLGKKSAVTAAKKQLGGLDPDDRKVAGQAINVARTSLEAAVAAAVQKQLQEKERERKRAEKKRARAEAILEAKRARGDFEKSKEESSV